MPKVPSSGRAPRLAVLALAAALAVACATALGSEVRAQAKPGSPGLVHRWDAAPLQDALYELADVAGVSLVFAHRLVEGQTVSAVYKEGEEPDAALAQLLAGTGLRAERIRRGRYVVLAEPLNVLVEPDDPAAYTGTLEGRIVDAATGEALWGAHAWLVDLDLGGVAAADGAFYVPDLPTGEYTVRFSHVGYRPVRVRLSVYPLSPQLPPTIRLQPETFTTDDATVQAGDVPEPEPGLTDLASRQAAALPVHLGEGDLGQALAWLPGLARDGAGGGLVVRGADPHLTRYLRDGVPFVEPWHAFGLFSALQPEAYRRVRFHRGSLPAELGGGLAGVVEVETKDGLVEKPTGVAALSPLSVRAVAETPLTPGLGLLVAGRGSLLDGVFAPTLRREAAAVVLDPLGLRTLDDQDVAHGFYDAEARLTWAPDAAHRVAFGAYLGGDRLDARLPAAEDERLAVDDRWGNRVVSAHYRFLGRRAFVAATAYGTRYDLQERTTAADAASPFTSDYRVGYGEAGLRVDVDYFRSLRHQFRFGVHAAHHGLETALEEAVEGGGSRAESADNAGFEASAYVQDAWQPTDLLHVQAGLRADAYTEGEYLSLSPRLHVRYAVRPERLYVRGGLSRQVQVLHRVRDRYAYTYELAASRWLLPSDAVRPASAWQAGLGAEWAPTTAAAPVALAFSADVYGRLLDDVLEPLDPAGWTDALAGPGVAEDDLLRFYRPSEGRAVGLELAARAERGPWVLGLSYALSHAVVRVPGAEDGWRPSRYSRPHVLGLLAQRRSERFSFAARLTVQSGLPTPYLDGAGAPMPGPLDRHAPEARLDLAVGYRFSLFGLQWDASAQALGLGGRPTGAPPFADGTAAFLATDVRGLPLLPVLSLQATW
jgi:hypothetical protein